MQVRAGALILSPTDLTKHLACGHVTTLDLAVARGRLAPPAQGVDEALQLIFDKGLAHEQAYLARLQAQGAAVTVIDPQLRGAAAEAATLAAMRAAAPVIYQATLCGGGWTGAADFLLRVDGRPSALGDHAYDVADTKLARRLKVPALLQMAAYAERLEQLQGVPPQRLAVVAGDRSEHGWRLLDVAAYARRARGRLRWAIDNGAATEAVPAAYCPQCRWLPRCQEEWQAADDLSLVAGMRADQRHALREAGVATVKQLAAAAPEQLVVLSAATRERLARQARLQVRERDTGVAQYELLRPRPAQGFARLPEPDEGDVYLDFEGDPFAADGAGREYLAGLLDRHGEFRTWWAHDSGAEAAMVERLLAALTARWQDWPGMHIYHYAAYEQTALKRLTGRHGVGEGMLDALLRGERFVDLHTVVRQSVAIGKPSYSIKQLEDLYWGQVRHAEGEQVGDALSSVVEYERYLVTGDSAILGRIAEYNQADVASTRALHDWLELRRAELADDPDVAWRRPTDSDAAEAADSEAIEAEKLLAQQLLDVGEDLLAGLVGWHRREDRPQWWAYFGRAHASDEDLVDDVDAIGRIGAPTPAGELVSAKTGRVTSLVWRYEFPPQDCRLGPSDSVHDVDARVGCGEIVAIDAAAGWVTLRRSCRLEPLAPRAMGQGGPIRNDVLKAALARDGKARLAGLPTLGQALVHREAPADLGLRPGETPAQAVTRVGLALSGQVLAVQGPPGAGKTYAASALIRALLDAGRRVGVTALSHAVIRNLLTEVGRPALHKVGAAPADGEAMNGPVRLTGSNQEVATALATGQARLVGGTAWLWAREELRESVDVLVVDEAGQFSLANAVAVAGAARAMVLLGDPQQLTQPTKADHPHGAAVSALGHLIQGAAVIAPTRGLFLDRTWRMHPEITRFVSDMFYDGQFRSERGLDRQRVDAPGPLTGAGLRWAPVAHQGNVADSPQEAQAVADLVAGLLAGAYADAAGASRPMTVHDVLVVAPYNAHVHTLAEALPPGVRCGTVDKIQGQQAPVVIYAMASSSAADAPRGVDFLYDLHRLNVAVSRAKAMAVIVGSPALLDAPVRTPEQLRRANALCEFVERAAPVSVA